MTELHIYIFLALGAALTVVTLALLTIKALNAAVRLALGIAAGIGLAVIAIIALQAVFIPTLVDVDVDTDLALPTLPQMSVADPLSSPRGLSAATSITITLSLIVVSMLALVTSAVGGWWWWTQRQKHERLELMAMLYGSSRTRLPAPQRRAHPRQRHVVLQQQPSELEPWEVVQQ